MTHHLNSHWKLQASAIKDTITLRVLKLWVRSNLKMLMPKRYRRQMDENDVCVVKTKHINMK